MLVGVIGGALGGLLHAIATVTFGVDHIVSGVAITSWALGVTRFLSALIFVDTPGGGVTQSPQPAPISDGHVPGIGGALRDAGGQALVPGLRRRRASSAA